jgi:hypothetical protein
MARIKLGWIIHENSNILSLIRSIKICKIKEGFKMRGEVKLFTLSMDLRKARRYEMARSEKIDSSIPSRISVPLNKAQELNA